jgi:hypothetical protein
MRILKYNPRHVPPTWFGLTPDCVGDISITVKDEDYDFCKRETDDYPLVPLAEFASLIDHTRISWEQFRYADQKHELIKQLGKGQQ